MILTDEPTPGLKILTSIEFESRIKCIMESKEATMIEAIIMYCEDHKIEVETAASLVTPRMKVSIENEAIKSRMIVGAKAKLPL